MGPSDQMWGFPKAGGNLVEGFLEDYRVLGQARGCPLDDIYTMVPAALNIIAGMEY